MNGIFAVNKPSGPSSAEIVSQLKKALNSSTLVEGSEANTGGAAKKKKFSRNRKGGKQWWRNKQQDVVKVGHGGTLDPLASGVMIIGVGEGTRQLTRFLTDCTKTYEAVAMFGVSTDTYDSTGKILEHAPTSHLTIEAIKEAIASKFSGEILQFPPIYSALKMNGKPLYEYAREGIPLPKQIESRKVTVDFFNVVDESLNWDQTEYTLPAAGEASAEEKEMILRQGQEMLKHVDSNDLSKLTSTVSSSEAVASDTDNEDKKYPTLKLRFSVSSGTYIRSLIHDLAKAVGSTAHMTKLVRVQQGPFSLDSNVFNLQDIVEAPPRGLPDTEWVPLVEYIIANGPTSTIADAKKDLTEKQAAKAKEAEFTQETKAEETKTEEIKTEEIKTEEINAEQVDTEEPSSKRLKLEQEDSI